MYKKEYAHIRAALALNETLSISLYVAFAMFKKNIKKDSCWMIYIVSQVILFVQYSGKRI